jgi:hypothetical protein
MTKRTQAEIGAELIRRLKRKWNNDGWIVCGKRGQIGKSHPSEVADIMARMPEPKMPNFCRIACDEALRRMGRPFGAAKYLGVSPSYIFRGLRKPAGRGKD